MLYDMTRRRRTKKKPIDRIICENIRALMAYAGINKSQLAEISGVSLRHINYILDGERKPTIEKAEKLGEALGVDGWLLMKPDLVPRLATSGKLGDLIDAYSNMADETQKYIDMVAEREGKYDGG